MFHLQCCRRVLENRWLGPRITFGFMSCPICKVINLDEINSRLFLFVATCAHSTSVSIQLVIRILMCLLALGSPYKFHTYCTDYLHFLPTFSLRVLVLLSAFQYVLMSKWKVIILLFFLSVEQNKSFSVKRSSRPNQRPLWRCEKKGFDEAGIWRTTQKWCNHYAGSTIL